MKVKEIMRLIEKVAGYLTGKGKSHSLYTFN